MQSKPFPGEPSVNVRRLLEREGTAALADLMRRRAGYVPQARPLEDFAEAVFSGRALRCMGEPGCGKTAFGKALRYALNTPLFYLQCHEELTAGEVLSYWADKDGPRTRENLMLCDPLAAYEYCANSDEVPVLVIDEFDKTRLGVEYMLLEVFENRQATIPNLRPYSVVGIPEDSDHLGPIVIITANNERELSDPTVSRSIFTYFKNPTPQEEVAILRSRVPSVSKNLLSQYVKMIHTLRGIGTIRRKPGIRESLSFLTSLVRKRVERIDEAVIKAHMGHLAKTPGDVDNFLLKVGTLAMCVGLPHAEIDMHVELAFADDTLFVGETVEV